MIFVDSHTHTQHSYDCTQKMEGMVAAARKAGITVMTITDHCELVREKNCPPWVLRNIEMEDRLRPMEKFSDSELQLLAHESNQQMVQTVWDSFDQADALRRESGFSDMPGQGAFCLLTGVELAQALHAKEPAAKLLAGRAFDFVLGSVHHNDGEEDPYFADCSGWSKEQGLALLERYAKENLALARQGDFDSLAHLGYPERYLNGNYHLGVSLADLPELVDEILKTLIDRDKALEFNTGGIRKAYGLPSPLPQLAQRYYALGGRRVTIGSDAHYPAHLAADLPNALKNLEKIGFAGITVYLHRQPMLLPFSQMG